MDYLLVLEVVLVRVHNLFDRLQIMSTKLLLDMFPVNFNLVHRTYSAPYLRIAANCKKGLKNYCCSDGG
jgi:hypothetical protein